MNETFEVDLSGYVNTRGGYLKPGKYTLVVEDVDTMTSKAGNPMWKVTSSVVDGESKGETVVDFLTITQKAMFRVVAFLNGLGIPTPKKSLSIPKSMMVGKMFEATVDDDSYGGSVSSKIQSYASVAQPGSADLPDDDQDELREETAQVDPDDADLAADEPTAPKAEPKPANARQQVRAAADDDLDL